MIDGITVLATAEVGGLNWALICLVTLACAGLTFLGSEFQEPGVIVFGITALITIGFATVIQMKCYPPNTEYKVTISDQVKITEFNEKYEIVDKDGAIYTIRERE